MTQFVAVAQVTQASLIKVAPGTASENSRLALSEYICSKVVKPEV